jgi:altronate dehydratase
MIWPSVTPLLRLAETDPIAVATRDIAAGECVVVAGTTVTVAAAVPLGHKVALRAIAAGEKVEKYRVPIGSATADIAPGEIVHTHNLRSDYIPTYTLQSGHRFGEEA